MARNTPVGRPSVRLNRNLQTLSHIRAAGPRNSGIWERDADLEKAQPSAGHVPAVAWPVFLYLTYACTGVVYGDVGTSPLYVFATTFSAGPPSQEQVLGAASLIMWSITLLVLVKYVLIVMFASDHGEGGTFALYSLICRTANISPVAGGDGDPSANHLQSYSRTASTTAGAGAVNIDGPGADALDGTALRSSSPNTGSTPAPNATRVQHLASKTASVVRGNGVARDLRRLLQARAGVRLALLLSVLLMTSMVIGDGVLTPAVSVLSAVSGIQTGAPEANISQDTVVGVSCAIIVLLFLGQRFGSGRVGSTFAPIVLIWFSINAGVGIYNIHKWEGPSIFRVLSPHYGYRWFADNGRAGWEMLSGIFLSVTGCEALFADMGHFGANPIRTSFIFLAYPALMLTYLGQASWLLYNPDLVSTTFYSCIPTPIYWPMFVISILAAVVASQAMITGAFSILHQSINLGCFPRLDVVHTSKRLMGQVYIPAINWILMVLTVAVVAGFQNSTTIGNAYGIAVNTVMLGTTWLMCIVLLLVFRTPLYLVLPFGLLFTVIEGVFLSANLNKVPHGGWFSLMVGVVVGLLTWLWTWGAQAKARQNQSTRTLLSDLVALKRPSITPSEGGSSQQLLVRADSLSPVVRIPGLALVFAESTASVPAAFRQLVQSWGVHSTVVFVTIRQVTVPFVHEHERLLVLKLSYPGFYQAIARQGYMEEVHLDTPFTESLLAHMHMADMSALKARANISLEAGKSWTQASRAGASAAAAAAPSSSHGAATAAAATADAGAATARRLPRSDALAASSMGLVSGIATSAPVATSAPADTSAYAAATAFEITERAAPATSAAPGNTTAAPANDSIAAVSAPISAAAGGAAAAGAAAPAAAADRAVLAQQATHVLTRPLFRAARGSNAARRMLLEGGYGTLHKYAARAWQKWDLPADRLFEVGTIMEL